MQEKIHAVFAYSTFSYVRNRVLLLVVTSLSQKPTDSKYSIVVSFCSMQIAIAACELYVLFLAVGDISSAYLEAFALENILLHIWSCIWTACWPLFNHFLCPIRPPFFWCTLA
jgi:hypothetical protein